MARLDCGARGFCAVCFFIFFAVLKKIKKQTAQKGKRERIGTSETKPKERAHLCAASGAPKIVPQTCRRDA